MVYRVLLTLAWLFGVAYSQVPTFWFLAHPFAERWRARRRPYLILVPVWLAEMLLVAAITWRWREVELYRVPWLWIPAALLIALGGYLYHAAHQGFTHEQLVGRSELESAREQRLATSGIRRRMRHPVYAAHFCELLALSLATGLAVLYALLLYIVAADLVLIRLEDSELERRFGDTYRDYRRRVPALLPRLRKS